MIHLAFDADTYGAYAFISGGLAIAGVFGIAFLVNLITEKINTRKDRTR